MVTNVGTAGAGSMLLDGDLVDIVDSGAPGWVLGGETVLGTADGAWDGLDDKTGWCW